jgi:hypothetical protein
MDRELKVLQQSAMFLDILTALENTLLGIWKTEGGYVLIRSFHMEGDSSDT